MANRLITQFLQTPNGGDVFLQAVPTTQQTADALALVTAVGSQGLVYQTDSRLNRLDAAELIAARLAMKAGNITVAVAADSTANDLNDWLPVWARLTAIANPDLRVEMIRWNTGTEAWSATEVFQVGTGVPGSGGVALKDTFTRSGEIVGSTTDDGKVWGGNTGIYSANGSVAGATAFGGLTFTVGSKDMTNEVKYKLTTTSTGATQAHRQYLGGGFFVMTSISSTGQALLSVYKFAGSVLLLGNLVLATEVGITANSATVQDLTVKASISVAGIVLTVTSASTTKIWNVTVAQADYDALTTVAKLEAQGAQPGIKMDEVTFSTPVIPGTYQTLKIYNGAAPGTALTYQQSRIAAMWPASTPIDVLIMSGGHNYGSMTGPLFVTALEAFLTAYRTVQPSSLVAVSSQNPRFAPAADVLLHKLRQVELRLWARRNGFAYIPAMEAFVAQPDGGLSLVSPDGIHPTTSLTQPYTQDGWGSTLWAKVWAAIINSRLTS